MQLDSFQEVGKDFLSGLQRGMLFDDMGLGKTIQSIAALNTVQAEKSLVICPAVARIGWSRELKTHLDRARSVEVVLTAKHEINRGDGVTVVPYDLVHKNSIRNQLLNNKWDVIILDESHYLKEPESLRTQAVYGPYCDGEHSLVDNGFMVWQLSGTPAPNHVGELWSTLHTCYPEIITFDGKPLTYFKFLSRYAKWYENKYGTAVVTEAKNEKELLRLLKPVRLRRLKKDVLKDLPPARFATCYLDVKETASHVYKMEQHPEVDRLRELLADDAEVNLTAFSALIDTEYQATLRRITGIVKGHAVLDLMKYELLSGLHKIVLMCWHREPIDILVQGLNESGFKTVGIYGGLSPHVKQHAIDSFQHDESVRVFVGQLGAAGEAITLTAAHDLMFVEMSWTPRKNDQVRDRIHRWGQKNPVLIRCATLPGSIDELVTRALQRKVAALEAVEL